MNFPMNGARFLRVLKGAASAAVVALSLTACSLPGTEPGAREAWLEANDPFEPLNRAVFGVNEAADFLLLGPAAYTYNAIVPDPIRDSVKTFTRNLLSPLTIANQLLQGDWDGAIHATGRFLVNTVLGAGGIADVATAAGIPDQTEDFGQTLAVWGFQEGPYLVLPLLGPSNFRDAMGYAVDTVADPVRIHAMNIDHEEFLYGRAIAGGIDKRSRVLKEVEDLRKNSVDYYATLRSLYRQKRKADIEEKANVAQPPEYPAFEKAPEAPAKKKPAVKKGPALAKAPAQAKPVAQTAKKP
jgi:phospholipid-binding lipoprotein MlaA